jgi:23S rRNA pseudouridine1911/1915/1917 synthase
MGTSLLDGEHVAVEGPLPLDRQLRAIYARASWSVVRRAIRTGKVRVDGEVVREVTTRVPAGATIAVNMSAPRDGGVRLDPRAILHLDADVVVVDKPPMMATVADAQRKKGTLAQILTERLSRRSSRKVPVGVVSRLDVQTSGLVVFTRNEDARKHLKEQFASRTAERTYLALVSGTAEDATYTSHLVEYADGKRKSTKNRRIGKWARTHVECLEQLEGASLVRCRLETGRTHQIRIHLSEAGHPLLGDARYARRAISTPAAPRVMLHAATLTFEHPSGQRMSFESPMPEDMAAVLEALRA